MGLSKAWCGLFSAIGAGLGGAYYLANRGNSFIYKMTNDFLMDLLTKNISLQNVNVNIHVDKVPQAIPAAIDIQFNLRQTLNNTLIKSMEELPAFMGEALQGFIWEQAAVIFLVVLGVGGLSIYMHKKFSSNAEKSPSSVIEPLLNNFENKENEEHIINPSIS